jgi:hypothetical protein
MGKVAATGKWVPFTDETATDGSAVPQGIYMGDDIPAADIVAGDVEDVPILVHGMKFNEDKLVIENSKTLDTIVAPSDATNTYIDKTVRDILRERTLIPMNTQSGSRAENA